MNAIILAAGMGRRLSLGIPKCLIEIAGTSILKRQVAALRAAGAERFIIVVGYRAEDVRAHLADERGPFTFITNDRYGETNTIFSLYLARAHFGGGFFYANGDVVFDGRLTRRLLPAGNTTVMAVKPGHWGQEEVKVMVEPLPGGAGCRVSRIGKALDPARSYGEFVGVARFGSDLVIPLGGMLSHCVEGEGMVGEHFEQAVDRLSAIGHFVVPVDVQDLPCGEIDFPEDLDHALRELGPRLEA
jgi:choline kinase